MKISERQRERAATAIQNASKRAEEEINQRKMAEWLLPDVYWTELSLVNGRKPVITWRLKDGKALSSDHASLLKLPSHIVSEVMKDVERVMIDVYEEQSRIRAEKRKKWGLLDKILPSL